MKIGGNAGVDVVQANRTAAAWTVARENSGGMADATKVGAVNYTSGLATYTGLLLTDTSGFLAGGVIAAQQYAPIYVDTSGADCTIHSIATGGSHVGNPVVLANPYWGSNDIVLPHQSTTEVTAALRITTPGGRTLRIPPGHAVALKHTGTTWAVVE